MKWIRSVAIVVAILAISMLAVAGPGTRFGVWGVGTGIQLLQYAAFAGIAAIALTLLALAVTRPRGKSLGVLVAALALGCMAFGVPWSGYQKAKQAPPIHDISTDTKDPPSFVAVLPLRKDALNPATYGGDTVAAKQHEGYPDIQSAELTTSLTQTFARALQAAKDMEWAIVAADSSAGRIEATATTRWFGFKDDIVVRIRPNGAGSRLDVRSVSRVGGSDVGTNAARIRAYLARLASS